MDSEKSTKIINAIDSLIDDIDSNEDLTSKDIIEALTDLREMLDV